MLCRTFLWSALWIPGVLHHHILVPFLNENEPHDENVLHAVQLLQGYHISQCRLLGSVLGHQLSRVTCECFPRRAIPNVDYLGADFVRSLLFFSKQAHLLDHAALIDESDSQLYVPTHLASENLDLEDLFKVMSLAALNIDLILVHR